MRVTRVGVNRYIVKSGVSKAELARRIGFGKTQLMKVLCYDAEISDALKSKLSIYFSTPENYKYYKQG